MIFSGCQLEVFFPMQSEHNYDNTKIVANSFLA